MGLEPGLEGSAEASVDESMTAASLGSGDVPVLGTPAVLALVERAAVRALQGHVGEGLTSVGSRVELRHLAPTVVGAPVWATARLAAIEGRTLRFDVEVADPAGTVARGRHERVLVDRGSFLDSAGRR
jgi:fluoroacetyl-CoA thioesterase